MNTIHTPRPQTSRTPTPLAGKKARNEVENKTNKSIFIKLYVYTES